MLHKTERSRSVIYISGARGCFDLAEREAPSWFVIM